MTGTTSSPGMAEPSDKRSEAEVVNAISRLTGRSEAPGTMRSAPGIAQPGETSKREAAGDAGKRDVGLPRFCIKTSHDVS
jgi:hypothetical protein